MTAAPDSAITSSPRAGLPRMSLVVLGGVLAGMMWAHAWGIAEWAGAAPFAVAAVMFVTAGRNREWSITGSIIATAVVLGIVLQIPMERERAAGTAAIATLGAESTALVQIDGVLAEEPWIGQRSVLALVYPGATLGIAGHSQVFPAPIMVRARLVDDASRTPWRTAIVGDRVHGMGTFEPLADAPEPGDFDAWLDSHGVRAVVFARVVELDPPTGGRSTFAQVRAFIKARTNGIEDLFARVCDPERAALLTALTLGRTGGLTGEQREAFRATGLSHLYSVSGLHTGTVGLVLIALGGLLGLSPRWRAAMVIGGLFVFCAMVGFRTPSLRAALIVSVMLLQALAWRGTDRLAGLASVALVLVVARPISAWQLDFQLSFLCALVLVLGGPLNLWIEKRLGEVFRWDTAGSLLIAGAQILVTSTLIQLVLAPMMLRHFGEVSLIAPLANLVGIPLSAVAMVLGLAGAALEYLSPTLGEWIAALAGGFAWLLDKSMALLAAMAVVSVRAATPWPAWLVAACYLLMVAGGWIARTPRPWVASGVESFARSVLVVAVAIVAWSWLGPRAAMLTATFIDVGQGDALLLQAASGESMLVDAGPPGEGREIVGHLHGRGVEQLDILVLTHADADHVGGAAEVVRALRPRVLFVGGSLASTEAWRDLALAVEAHGVAVRQVARGDHFALGDDIKVDVLHPTPAFLEPGDDRNDASIVLRVACGEVTLLLTGDAEAEAERDMLAAIPGDRLRADVLKAGHHGSASSTTAPFLAAVRPTHAVLSCGRDNRYGHPSPHVMARLAEWNVAPWRTDQQGTITMTIDGQKVVVRVERRGVAAPPLTWSRAGTSTGSP